MKTIPTNLRAHLAQEVTSVCTCWKATLKDGTVLGFTDHHADLVVSGATYVASAGYTRSAIQTSGDFAVDNLDLEGAVASPSITEADVLAGRWDYAAIEIFEVNYADLTMGVNPLRRGRIGELTLKGGIFVAELRGLMQALQQDVGELYSPSCRAQLGDARCKIVITDYAASGTVSSATSNRVLATNLPSTTVRLTPTTTGAPDGDYFAAGLLTWVAGANAGLKMEVKTYNATTGALELCLPMPYAVVAGDTFSVHAGCRGRFVQDCKARFGNVVNFRGEPHLPGIDKMMDYGGRA